MPTFPSRMSAVQSPIIPTVGQWVRDRPGIISLGQGVVFYARPRLRSKA